MNGTWNYDKSQLEMTISGAVPIQDGACKLVAMSWDWYTSPSASMWFPNCGYYTLGEFTIQNGALYQDAVFPMQYGEQMSPSDTIRIELVGTAPDSLLLTIDGTPVEAVYTDGHVVYSDGLSEWSGRDVTMTLTLWALGVEFSYEETFTVGIDTGVEDAIQPKGFTLEQNYPNPFNPETCITFTTAASGQVMFSVYDLRGRKVRQLVNELMSAGRHEAVWHGTNDAGERVASGVYFYVLRCGDQVLKKKCVLLK